MIGFVSGKLSMILDNGVIIDNNGIGYKIMVSPRTISNLPSINTEVKLFTHMNVREDDISLFGFFTIEEINMFNMLTSVSGIGSKVGMGILGNFTPSQLILAIVSEDANMLSKAPGVGKKTAQRIILELKDKMKTENNYFDTEDTGVSVATSDVISAKQDAIDALLALGYSRSESIQTVMEVALPEMSTEEIIKLALKKFVKI